MGGLPIDVVDFAGALGAIEKLVEARAGGMVFTPNVDHVVLVERNPRFREVYSRVSLSLVDGTPVLWAARLLGSQLPEKVSGSDLVVPLAERAAARARISGVASVEPSSTINHLAGSTLCAATVSMVIWR